MMMKNALRTFLFAFVLAAACSAATLYQVTVDTSSLGASASGFLDFQFNGSGNPSPSGTAVVSGFSGSNLTVDDSLAQVFGAVSGNLVPGPLQIANTDPFNDYFVPFSISGAGSNFTFQVALTGDILNPPPGNLDGTDFALLIFADDGFTPLLTQDGQLARIAIDALGGVVEEAFAPAIVAPVVIPEPSTWMLAAAGLGMAAVRLARSRR